jgi:MoaA/NifB/PqqE/SkfB family radical SAM enzyme
MTSRSRTGAQYDWESNEDSSANGINDMRRKYKKKAFAQNDEVTAAIVNRELNIIREEHLAEGDLNNVVSRLVKKVRDNSSERKSEENKMVTKTKKGRSLSEINYQMEEIDMFEPSYMQNIPQHFEDVYQNED